MIKILNIKYQISNTQTKYVKIFMFLICVFYFCFFIFAFSIAQPISSSELINNAKQYDGKTVVYAGEVIGEIMIRGEYAWINVNDGSNAIGIWLPKGLTKEILYTGSYKSKGDWLEITGIFYRSCPQHGGDLDIHAQRICKMSAGRETPERLDLAKGDVALGLLGILCIVWILRRLKIK